MMNERRGCTDNYRQLISAYIDGDLDAGERRMLLEHLAGCDTCRRSLEAYRRIGSRLRSLPPVVPPPELRDSIFDQTVESGSRKLYVLTSRVGYSVATLAAVALIFVVAVYLLVSGYQRSIDPEVVGSQPGSGVIWPLSRPISIAFNKEMDRESVEAALSISPASERERLTRTWQGNTLVLGQNQPLRPGASYVISITTSAEDKWGKKLGSEFQLQFETSESFALDEPVTPTATATATPEPPPTVTLPPTDAPIAPETVDIPTEEPSAGPPPTDTPAPPPEDPPPSDPPPPDVEPSPTQIVPEDPGVPTNEPEPTATTDPGDGPSPTATPEPTWTPRPLPTATPTPEPPTATPEPPTATQTPETIPVVSAFGNVYWGNEIVRVRLGEPVAAASTTGATELDFQHGAMFSRADTGQVYVLESRTGFWSVVYPPGQPFDSEPGPVEGTWIPGGDFGALWMSEPWIADVLGYALAPSGESFDSRAQSFEFGAMVMSSSGQIYVLYDDGTWELYPDPGS